MSRNYPLDEILLPMGATTVKDEKKMEELWDSEDYIAEEKFDGSRYLSIGGRFFSRRVSVVDHLPVEKTENVPHLYTALSFNSNLILDGEVYLPNQTSNEVTSIMGSLPERALKIQEGKGYLYYVVYDILRDLEGNWLLDEPWKERRKVLEEVFTNSPLSSSPYIQLAQVIKHNKREFYGEIMRRGGEGVMLKNINGLYVPDKRPRWNWIKVKKEITADVVITGFKPAKREYEGKELKTWQYWESYSGDKLILNGLEESKQFIEEYGEPVQPVTKYYWHGWIGSIEFSQYNNKGELVPMGECSGISEELRKDMSENPEKYIGQVMEISAMQRTKDGYFRHPQFLRLRDDKNPKDCLIGEF